MQHLYLHVPFCVRRCSYCDFSIAVRKRIPAGEYLDAVMKEATAVESAGEIRTIYLGGGTPSLLPSEAIHALLRGLPPKFRNPQSTIRNDAEITIEANPEDVTVDSARAWKAAGINRVSLGGQSFDDTVLKWMHRSHDAARIGAAMHALRGAGIENISLDLIFALPDELHRDWERDLDMALALRPTHPTTSAMPRSTCWPTRGCRSSVISSTKSRMPLCPASAPNTIRRIGRGNHTWVSVRPRTPSTARRAAGTCAPGKPIGGLSPRGAPPWSRRSG